MNRAVQLTLLLLYVGLALPAAYGQENCTLQTMTGTYAIQERGSGLNFDPSTMISFPYFSGRYAAFGNVGEVTFLPNGNGEGFYWIYAGAINGGNWALHEGLKAVPVKVRITEMNRDCTGKIKYDAKFDVISATIEERFILLDNGREFRSVPSLIANGIDNLAWLGEGHRISGVNSCGPQTAYGSYLLSCENLVDLSEFNLDGVNADTFMIRADVSLTGEYAGKLYEKLGPWSVDGLGVNGTMAVNPDCSYSSTLVIPSINASFDIRGVFFNGGKEYYGMSVRNPAQGMVQEVKYSLCRGTRIGQ